jgi:thiol-disulfide isomerase/thioredoxin
LWIWIGLTALIVVVGVVAVIVSRSDSGSSSSDSSSNGTIAGGSASPSGGTVVPDGTLDFGTSVTVEGDPLPAQPTTTTAADPAVGQTIPTVTGQSFDGSSITIAPTGTPQLIMGVAHWCPHCQAEVPRIQDWLDTNGMPADVQLTTVATSNNDQRTNFPAGPWLRAAGWSVPTIIDDQKSQAAEALGVGSFPYFLVVDGQGKVVFRTSGEITMTQWEALLEAARTGVSPAS